MTNKLFACPACGWKVETPHSDADLIEAVSWHGGNVDPTMKMTREEILKMAKSE